MGFFDFLKPSRRVQGRIGFFGLEEWWSSAFSDDERRQIQTTFRPLGFTGDSLTSGSIISTDQTAVGFLQALAGWFTKEQDRPIAYKMLDKAEELARTGVPVLDVHFLYDQEIGIYYRDRDKQAFLDKAILACRKQIALAPKTARAFKSEYRNEPLPTHRGYEQLAIILEKRGDYREVIDLCAQAQAQGWSGTWARRIERCKKGLTKT